MVAMTVNLELPDSIAAYLAHLPVPEQSRIVASALASALHDASEGDVEDGLHLSATALLSQAALAEDWERPEEDEAWSHLQLAR